MSETIPEDFADENYVSFDGKPANKNSKILTINKGDTLSKENRIEKYEMFQNQDDKITKLPDAAVVFQGMPKYNVSGCSLATTMKSSSKRALMGRNQKIA